MKVIKIIHICVTRTLCIYELIFFLKLQLNVLTSRLQKTCSINVCLLLCTTKSIIGSKKTTYELLSASTKPECAQINHSIKTKLLTILLPFDILKFYIIFCHLYTDVRTLLYINTSAKEEKTSVLSYSVNGKTEILFCMEILFSADIKTIK